MAKPTALVHMATWVNISGTAALRDGTFVVMMSWSTGCVFGERQQATFITLAMSVTQCRFTQCQEVSENT